MFSSLAAADSAGILLPPASPHSEYYVDFVMVQFSRERYIQSKVDFTKDWDNQHPLQGDSFKKPHYSYKQRKRRERKKQQREQQREQQRSRHPSPPPPQLTIGRRPEELLFLGFLGVLVLLLLVWVAKFSRMKVAAEAAVALGVLRVVTAIPSCVKNVLPPKLRSVSSSVASTSSSPSCSSSATLSTTMRGAVALEGRDEGRDDGRELGRDEAGLAKFSMNFPVWYGIRSGPRGGASRGGGRRPYLEWRRAAEDCEDCGRRTSDFPPLPAYKWRFLPRAAKAAELGRSERREGPTDAVSRAVARIKSATG